jgi:ribonuclease-3
VIKTIAKRIKILSSPQKDFYLFLRSLLGFYPTRLNLYDLAVKHKSSSTVDSLGNYINNERLEFLGDAVIGTIIADFLYQRFPRKGEGYLTQMRSNLTSQYFLTKLTYQIGLHTYVESNITNIIESSKIYGDVFEAIIGAIYLDQGYQKAKETLIKEIISNYVDLDEIEQINPNYKSQLIEWGQKNKKEIRFATQKQDTGDANREKMFVSSVKIENKTIGKASGKTKKEAQQNASKMALKKMSNENSTLGTSATQFV